MTKEKRPPACSSLSIVYDQQNKTAALAHISTVADVRSLLNRTITNMGISETKRLQARIIGGYMGNEGTKRIAIEIIDELMGHKKSGPKYGRGHILERKYEWMLKIAFEVFTQ